MSDDDYLNAGYSGLDVPTPPPVIVEEVKEEPVIEAPKLAQITEQQFQELLTKANAIDEIKANSKREIDRLSGTLGNKIQQLTDRQNVQPVKVNLTSESLKRLSAAYPDLSSDLAADLSEALQGQLIAQNPGIDQTTLDKLVTERLGPQLEQIQSKMAERLLDIEMKSFHRDWRKVVISKEFDQWAATLPQEEREKILQSDDPEIVGDAITQYKKSLEPVPVKQTTRQKRIETNINPKGVGGHADIQGEIDYMEAGYSGAS